MSLSDGRRWLADVEAQARRRLLPPHPARHVREDALTERLAGVLERASAHYPDMALIALPRDAVIVARAADDPTPQIQAVAHAIADSFEAAGRRPDGAEQAARDVLEREAGLDSFADFRMIQCQRANGESDPLHIIQTPINQTPDSLMERQREWSGLVQLGVTPAGLNRRPAPGLDVLHAFTLHELGHAASLAAGLHGSETARDAYKVLLEEMRADVFAVLATAQEGGDWAGVAAELIGDRHTLAVLAGSLDHWTVPALEDVIQEMQKADAPPTSGPRTLIAEADRIARAALPEYAELKAVSETLRALYDDRPAPNASGQGRALIDHLSAGYARARSTLHAYDPALEDAWYAHAIAEEPNRQEILLWARRYFEANVATPQPA